jgi:integrase
MSITWSKDHKRWRYFYNRVIDGQQHRTTKLLPKGWSKSRADQYDREQTGTLYAQSTGQEKKRDSINEAVQLYLTHKLPKLRNGKKAAQDMAHLIPYFQDKFLDELHVVAREYTKGNPKLAPGTVRNRLAYLRAACRYAFKEHGLGEHDPAERMVVPRPHNERQDYVTQEELEKIASFIKDADTKAITRIAFYTGMRWQAELLKLKPENVQEGWITVAKTKTDRPKMIPVHPQITDDLGRLPFKEHWRTYYRRFKAAAVEAGFPHIVMHTLRHSLASSLISKGATLAEVGGVLGHTSPQSTKRYSHLYPARLREIMKLVK